MTVTLLGTSHISPESAKSVRAAIESRQYGIVAVELDRERLHSLMSGEDRKASIRELIPAVGFSGAVFAVFAQWVQRKLGGRIGVLPGEEMRAAVQAAALAQVKVALIDQPIRVTLQRFSKAFTFREKLRLVGSAFRLTKVHVDLDKVPDERMVEQMIAELERASPAIAKVLVHERNIYMARKLQNLRVNHPEERILAVVGAGHVPGMRKLLDANP